MGPLSARPKVRGTFTFRNKQRICQLLYPTSFNAHIRQCAGLSLLRPSFESTSGDGILTVCPSASPFGLSLGPTNPEPIIVVQETLVFRRESFSLSLSLLMPTFAFPAAPAYLTVHLRRNRNAPLPILRIPGLRYHAYTRSSSMQHRSTSELLRTL